MSEEIEKTKKKITVVEYVDAAQLRKDLSFSTADLSTAIMEQAALFANYGVEASKASLQVDKFKMLLENTEAQIARQIRDDKASKGEKLTESALSELVTRHPKTIEARTALNAAKQIEGVAKIAVEAFRHRRDMLVQQGLISREEMKGELAVAVRNAKDEELRNTQDRILARRSVNAEE